jgi:iron complex transport system substrate-binding protein
MFKRIHRYRFLAASTFALSIAVTSLLTIPTMASTTFAKASTATKSFPVTIKSGGYSTTIKSLPKRIISLSPTATEILFAIGAGKQVLAVDDLSNYPTNAPISKLSAYTPNVEALAAKKPDLVILSGTSTNFKGVRSSLIMLNIPVLIELAPNQISDAYSEFRAIGKATDKVKQTTALVKKMQNEIAAIVKTARKSSPISFFHELDNTLYSATSQTFIGHVYSDFNLLNIADQAKGADSSGYPQLSQEYLVTANPQAIFLADAQYGESVTTVTNRPGWSEISAVKNNHILALPADYPSRWGPRLVDFYRFIAASIKDIS